MALTPKDESHALQIQAGIVGRKKGHEFEDRVTKHINQLPYPVSFKQEITKHVNIGNPALIILNYIANLHRLTMIKSASAISTGALATSEEGLKWLEVNGVRIKRCKSDLILTISTEKSEKVTVGVSTKQCNNKTPTNAQLFFTTARAFCHLLNQNGISVSNNAERVLRQFCGDQGFRPLDYEASVIDRISDPRRFFWEELFQPGREEWEATFQSHQNKITRLLLKKAYIDDPFTPDLLVHKTKRASSWDEIEVAIYTISELVELSRQYGGFSIREYSVRKGSFKDLPGVKHSAPRFGIVQMQRGGQKQHPEQLQFNLEAGYFYKIRQTRTDLPCNRSCK